MLKYFTNFNCHSLESIVRFFCIIETFFRKYLYLAPIFRFNAQPISVVTIPTSFAFVLLPEIECKNESKIGSMKNSFLIFVNDATLNEHIVKENVYISLHEILKK